MQKLIIPTHVNQTLFKVEQNGVEIIDPIVIQEDPNGVLKIVSNIQITNKNYIQLQEELQVGSKLIVLYNINDITNRNTKDIIKEILEAIGILKEAVKERITVDEINQYIEKINVFTQRND